MRFIHTADWHLGRYFHGMHLTADQREIIMGQLVPLVQEEKVDAVVIAGISTTAACRLSRRSTSLTNSS